MSRDELLEEGKERVERVADQVKESAHEAKERVAEESHSLKERIGEKLHHAKKEGEKSEREIRKEVKRELKSKSRFGMSAGIAGVVLALLGLVVKQWSLVFILFAILAVLISLMQASKTNNGSAFLVGVGGLSLVIFSIIVSPWIFPIIQRFFG